MDLEFYNEQKHSFFLDQFKQYSREPIENEKEFFEPLLRDIIGKISEVTGISNDFKLYFAMTDEDTLGDDLPINRFVHGFSFAGWMKGFDRNVVMIRAVNDREDWKDCLVNMLAHELGHQEFYSLNGCAPYSNLENIVFEGHAMNRAENVVKELGLDWKPGYRSGKAPSVDVESVLQVLDDNRSYDPDSIFVNGGSFCENAEGYHIAYLVVKDIVDRTSLSLEGVAEASSLENHVRKSLKTVLS